MTTCIIWCLTNCLLLAWDPVPDTDVTSYRVTASAIGYSQDVACCSIQLPPEAGPHEVCVQAIDGSGNLSPNPNCLEGGRFLRANFTIEPFGRQRKWKDHRRNNLHYCEAWP